MTNLRSRLAILTIWIDREHADACSARYSYRHSTNMNECRCRSSFNNAMMRSAHVPKLIFEHRNRFTLVAYPSLTRSSCCGLQHLHTSGALAALGMTSAPPGVVQPGGLRSPPLANLRPHLPRPSALVPLGGTPLKLDSSEATYINMC